MNKADKPGLVLIDGSSYLYRAFHVPNLQRLTAPDGSPTGAIYGVVNMVRKLVSDYSPDHIAVVFDARGKTFRHDMYPDYKANRPSMPDELAVQIEPLHEIIRAMGLPLIQVPGVEADDVIGTLATQAAKHGTRTLISTGDKDMAQLVGDHVTLINTMSNTTLDRDGVIEKFGVPPELIIDYLALMGDSSDNIPGIPKVGPKTAAKWLQLYGSLDALKEHADDIKGKVGESLREHLDDLKLSRELTTIRDNLDLDKSPADLAPTGPDVDKLRTLYRSLGFNSWLAQLDPADGVDPKEPSDAQTQAEYETVLDRQAFNKWVEKLGAADVFAFDTETTSLDYMQAGIVGVSFAIEPGKAAYVPVAHAYDGAPEQLDRDMVLAALRPLLEAGKSCVIGHNLKYDMSVLANHDIRLRAIADDTMLESYVFNSTASRHDMDSLSQRYLDHRTIKYEDVAGKGAKQLTFDQVPLEQAGPYAAEDADITLRLHRHLQPQIKTTGKLDAVLHDIEIPLIPVLSRMERNGVCIDTDKLASQSESLAARIAEFEAEAHAEAGAAFNLASPKQIQEILFEQQKLPVLAKTPKGAPSTAESVLQELALDFRLPELILKYRSLAKLKSTYTDKLPLQVNAETGRVHTSYHQAVAATGRLSSSDPNLQNIPVRTEEGRRIRQAFVAEPGNVLLAADYSQIELRIMAHLSRDHGLLDAFAAGEDIHSATAAEVFGTTVEDVTADQRRAAKAINFGLIYGMSAFGLAKQLGIERSAAQSYVDLYFERYPGVRQYMDETGERAREQGYVETLFGRRLYLPEINARHAQRRQAAERTAINAPMQGTAADIIKRAMIHVDQWLQKDQNGIRMIMQVHDELVFEVPEKTVDLAREKITGFMTHAADLEVPLIVDCGAGADWDAAH